MVAAVGFEPTNDGVSDRCLRPDLATRLCILCVQIANLRYQFSMILYPFFEVQHPIVALLYVFLPRLLTIHRKSLIPSGW